jgi:hypothetical protein
MSPHGGMVADLSVQVIDLNVRGCLLYRRRTREISEVRKVTLPPCLIKDIGLTRSAGVG